VGFSLSFRNIAHLQGLAIFMNKQRLLWFGVVIAMVFAIQARQGHAAGLSLTEEMSRQMRAHIELAKEKDGQLAAAIAAKEAAWQAVEIARAAMGLKITASGSAFYTDRTEQVQNLQGSSDLQRDFVAQQLVIAARQPIYRKREQVAIEQAAAKFQESLSRERQVELDLSGRVLMAWVEILAARDMMMLSQSMLEMAETILQETQRRYEAGEISIDQLGLEIARLQQRQADWVETVARLEIAEKMLMDIVGTQASVPSNFTLESAIPNQPPFATRSEVEELVSRHNYLLEAARQVSAAAALEIQKAQAGRLPTVEAFASVTAGENDVASYIKNEHRIGVQVVVPLYASGAFDAAIKQAEALLRQSQAEMGALEMQLRDRAWRAFMALQVSLIRIDSSRIGTEAAALRVEALRRGFAAGEFTRAEVGRAQAEYQQVRQQSVKEKLDYAKAWVELMLLTANNRAASNTAPAQPSPKSPTKARNDLVQR
jgi:outer membrane protein, protease secretion system